MKRFRIKSCLAACYYTRGDNVTPEPGWVNLASDNGKGADTWSYDDLPERLSCGGELRIDDGPPNGLGLYYLHKNSGIDIVVATLEEA
jgi:hypothetical protein